MQTLRYVALLWLGACAATDEAPVPEAGRGRVPVVRSAHLPTRDGLQELRADFREDHPGSELMYEPRLASLSSTVRPGIVFIQEGSGQGRIGEYSSELAVGDVAILRPGEELVCTGEPSALVFWLDLGIPADLPRFVRVDYDPSITDTPGGCATDPGAYRRIALTWLSTRGPYVLHGFNAHRVRIDDSFTHYHPVDGGFDEFYLVQEAPEGAQLLTSSRLARITDVEAERDFDQLFQSRRLHAGDLVYIPRGIAHRGLGGAVVHVLALPGFRPGAEIGLDEVIQELNEVHGLEGDQALPYHQADA